MLRAAPISRRGFAIRISAPVAYSPRAVREGAELGVEPACKWIPASQAMPS